MSISLEIGMVVLGLGAALLLIRSPKAAQSGLVALTCLAILLVGFTQPALAGAVNGDVLTNDQQKLNETLQSNPGDSQYQGIEYADSKGTPLGDQEITNKVESQVPENLKVSVSNGSVRLSGKVSDRGTAQAIIEEVKSIPGVHEVAYDLGLKNLSRK
ncbi:BON domain-containing protein [Leptolyngbya sp. CCNP1308]|uniref:BON domain-containing protein n=1 Tax=Leptolyngbya sp. CCNP1308 TaxID=3110255 RepID=UPI002B21F9C9|nr:BON domain-containing protein [Leptolyngbya sp. CCNP1308]MEA5448758.1 BON domain-containing protein [Leptolyngbya sp. CCNP1308]